MKVKLFFSLFLCLLFCLVSCASDRDHLSFIKYPMKVRGKLYTDSLECELVITADGECTKADILSPEALRDYTFICDGETKRILYNDMEIRLSSEEGRQGVFLLLDVFSVDRDSMSALETKSIKGKDYRLLTYPIGEANVTFYKQKENGGLSLIRTEYRGKEINFIIDSIEY